MILTNNSHTHRTLVKKLDMSHRLTASLLVRAPSFTVVAGVLADQLTQVVLSNGEAVHLKLPHHTHLNPGDVLLDERGMMVRVDAATQAVLAVTHPILERLIQLSLTVYKQGRALGWLDNQLLLAEDVALQSYLSSAGFSIQSMQGELSMNTYLDGLPMPEHTCQLNHGHEHKHAH
jgi:urease accessory protein UreE